jgi:hypothetical protein
MKINPVGRIKTNLKASRTFSMFLGCKNVKTTEI